MMENSLIANNNPLAAFFTIRVSETHSITKQTLKWYQRNVNKNCKVGDEEKSILIKLVDRFSELAVLYDTHLKTFLQTNKHSFKRDFIESEIKKVENFIVDLEAEKTKKKEWCGLLKRYKEFLQKKQDLELKRLARTSDEITQSEIRHKISENIEPVTPLKEPEVKPIFKAEVIPIMLEVFSGFFSEEDFIKFENILRKGDNLEQPILFKSDGKRLADAFKKLYEHDFITGCQKQDLEKWIINNYRYRNHVKVFTPDYIQKCISRNDNPCKSPIIEIAADGKIQKATHPRKKKYNNY